MKTCEDCGCPVEIKTSGKPPQEVAYSQREGRGEVYHDMSECVYFLRTELEAMKARFKFVS